MIRKKEEKEKEDKNNHKNNYKFHLQIIRANLRLRLCWRRKARMSRTQAPCATDLWNLARNHVFTEKAQWALPLNWWLIFTRVSDKKCLYTPYSLPNQLVMYLEQLITDIPGPLSLSPLHPTPLILRGK